MYDFYVRLGKAQQELLESRECQTLEKVGGLMRVSTWMLLHHLGLVFIALEWLKYIQLDLYTLFWT